MTFELAKCISFKCRRKGKSTTIEETYQLNICIYYTDTKPKIYCLAKSLSGGLIPPIPLVLYNTVKLPYNELPFTKILRLTKYFWKPNKIKTKFIQLYLTQFSIIWIFYATWDFDIWKFSCIYYGYITLALYILLTIDLLHRVMWLFSKYC